MPDQPHAQASAAPAASFKSAWGKENRVFITIKQQTKLYWVTTADHAEDWFIFAGSDLQARSYHEHYEGYGKGDAHSRLILSNVTLEKFMNGTPPCHARFEDLYQIGIEAGTIPGRRKGRFNGEIFRDGILEAIIELGRLRQALENGCAQVKSSSSSTTVPGVETGPRLVH
jgi:hypothetical protein